MLSFARVSAMATRKVFLVLMAEHMSIQRPFLSERCLANLASELALSSMSLTHMQGIGAARLELRPTAAASVSALITVHAHMSRQIRLIFSSVPTKTATEHISRFLFHVASIASMQDCRSCSFSCSRFCGKRQPTQPGALQSHSYSSA